MANKQKSAYLVAQSKKKNTKTSVMNQKGTKMPVMDMGLRIKPC